MYVKIIIEQYPDGFVACPVGLRRIVVAEGDTREGALADVKSAIDFHIETFGPSELNPDDDPVLDVFVAETSLAI